MWGRYDVVEQNNGYKMPVVGLGTWLSSPCDVVKAIDAALEYGYRHIDTAYVYDNEEDIKFALKTWLEIGRIRRDELYITSKLPVIGMHPGKVQHFCQLSLNNLGLSYLDLYLIHFPVGLKYQGDTALYPKNEDGTFAVDSETSIETIWKEMEELVKNGRVRSIGLSNFNEKQLKRIIKIAEIKPAVLQVELHAYMQQTELREFCKSNGIVIQAFGPFANPGRDDWFIVNKENVELLENKTVKKIAEHCNKTPAQVLLRHLFQHDVVVLPKSIHPERIRENIDLFDFFLTPSEMEMLDNLDKGDKGRTLDWSFFGPEFKSQPEYPFNNN